MIKAIKIRLLPTSEQEEIMYKTIGVARFIFNWGLARQIEAYKEEGKYIHFRQIKNEFIKLKSLEQYSWLKEVSSKSIAQVFEDLQEAYKRYFNNLSDKPKFKSKKKSRKSFYARYDRLNFKDGTVNLEKIGRVKYKTNYEIPIISKYNNPRVSFDGKYWYLSLGFEHEKNKTSLNDLTIGVDLGIKDLAVCSNGIKIKNINKSKEVKRLTKKLKRFQRQVSRKYQMNKHNIGLDKTNNIIKLEKEIRLIYRKLANIRNNHIHQATNMIVKTKPSKIVVEDLNIKGMMKNKYLAKAIQEQKMYEFIRQIEYKCLYNGIELLKADRFFPSSKTCSSCGHLKKDLSLSERKYNCNKCGKVIDRDLNAAINLSKYKLAS